MVGKKPRNLLDFSADTAAPAECNGSYCLPSISPSSAASNLCLCGRQFVHALINNNIGWIARHSSRVVMALGLALAAAPAAPAQVNYIWANSNTDWATSTSWTPSGGPPTSADFASFTSFGSPVVNPNIAAPQTVAGLVMDTSANGNGYTLTASAGGTLTITTPNTTGTVYASGAVGGIVVRGGAAILSGVNATITTAPFSMAIEIPSSGTLVLTPGTAVSLTGAALFTELRGAGSTLVLSGEGPGATPTLTQAGQNIRTNGGGNLAFLGNDTTSTSFSVPSISAGPGDVNITVDQPSVGVGTTVTIGQASSAVGVSLGRFSTSATYFVSATGPRPLGGGISTPTVLSLTAPLAFNGVISTSASASVPYVLYTTTSGSATTGTFANYDSTNGVIAAVTTPRNSAQFIDTTATGPAATENTNFQPDQATTTLTAAVTVNTLTINPSATNQVLNLNDTSLATTGLVLSGNRSMTISAGPTGAGSLFTGTTIREIAVLDPAAALTTDASLANGSAVVNKAGPGFLILTNTTNNQIGFATTTTNVSITGGVLRVPGTFANAATNVIALRGGVLEVDSAGGATTFSRALGTAAGNVNWRAATSFATAGSGGFSAVNGPLTINLGGATPATAFVWSDSNNVAATTGVATSSFIAGPFSLLFGSTRSDSTVIWTNPLGLDIGTPGGVPGLPSSQREIRVTRGTGGANDKTQFAPTATITGTAVTDLLKTGTGVLEFTGANTYAGNTLVKDGTLRLSNGTTGSATGTGSLLVFAGGTLGGAGTAQPASGNIVSIAGVVAPGDGIGTLSLIAPVTLTSNAVYLAQVGGSISDDLAVTGALTLSSGSTLTVTGTTNGSTYTLASYTSLVGTFTNLTLPSGYLINYGTGSNSVITIAPVPEPGFVLLACGTAIGGLMWRKRRPTLAKSRV
jgi:fibronectin-binding autotransporter adhesin